MKRGLIAYLNLVTLQAGISSKPWMKLPDALFAKLLNPFIQYLKSKDLISVQAQPTTLSWGLRHYSDLLILHFSDCFLRTYKFEENISPASAVSIATPF